jgi:hypothetical protein
MLSVKLKPNTSVRIGEATVSFKPHRGGGITLYIEAPREVQVVRSNAKKTEPRAQLVHADAIAAAIVAIGRVRELSGTVDAATHCRALRSLGDSLRDALYAHPKIRPTTRQEATC